MDLGKGLGLGGLTQQPLPVLDEDLGRGHHLSIRAVLPHRVNSHPDPRGLGMRNRDVPLGMRP